MRRGEAAARESGWGAGWGRRWPRGDGPGGRGAAAAAFVSSLLAGPGAGARAHAGNRGLEVGRGLRSRGRGRRLGSRRGERGGPRCKVRRGVSSCEWGPQSAPACQSPCGGREPWQETRWAAGRWTAKVLGAAAERSESLVMGKLGRPEEVRRNPRAWGASQHSQAFPPQTLHLRKIKSHLRALRIQCLAPRSSGSQRAKG